MLIHPVGREDEQAPGASCDLETEIRKTRRAPALDIEITARAGRLLMFPPYWMYQHEGLPPQSGDKYILSTYLLFTSARP